MPRRSRKEHDKAELLAALQAGDRDAMLAGLRLLRERLPAGRG